MSLETVKIANNTDETIQVNHKTCQTRHEKKGKDKGLIEPLIIHLTTFDRLLMEHLFKWGDYSTIRGSFLIPLILHPVVHKYSHFKINVLPNNTPTIRVCTHFIIQSFLSPVPATFWKFWV